MKKLLVLLALSLSVTGFAQESALHLKNALVVSHLDKQEDRFTLEIAVSEALASCGIKNMVSLNVLKQGGDPQVLLSDSISSELKTKGIDTYMLVSVRGFDARYKKSTRNFNLAEDLAAENLFPIYKEDIVSVTFEFHFYRDGKLVYTDLIRVSSAGSREKVLKKLRKKLIKRVNKSWK